MAARSSGRQARRPRPRHRIQSGHGRALQAQRRRRQGVGERATFAKEDLFESDFSKASVITMFLLPQINLKLRPKILDLKPGTRIVSNTFTMGEWHEDGSDTLDSECINWCTALLWIVPAKVGGTWKLPQGELTLQQSYQFITGTLKSGNEVTPIANGKLKGDQIMFNAGGVVYVGQVSGNSMQGTLSSGGTWTATRAQVGCVAGNSESMIEDRRWRVRRLCRRTGIMIVQRPLSLAHAGETYQPKSGQLGKDVVWVGNPEAMVQKMLDVAGSDAAGLTWSISVPATGATSLPRRSAARAPMASSTMASWSSCRRAWRPKSGSATERHSSAAMYSQRTSRKRRVVVLFLTPEMNIRLRPKLLALKPGARVVANTFAIGDWNPDQSFSSRADCEKFCSGRLWIVPAKVAGRWKLPKASWSSSRAIKAFLGR